MIVLKTEYARGGRGAATVRMKLKSLIGNFGTENVFKADDKIDNVILDKKECTYSYFADPDVRLDGRRVQPVRSRSRKHGRRPELPGRRHGRWKSCSTTARPSRWNCPPASSAKSPGQNPPSRATPRARCSKPAKIATGFEVAVPLFVSQGDKIEIDTRTGEYRKRV